MIPLFEAETGTPVAADAMRFGIRVVVALAYPCSDHRRTPKGLELVGRQYFGYDLDFRPNGVPRADFTGLTSLAILRS